MKEQELLKIIKDLITKNNYWSQIRDKDDRLTLIHDVFMNVWPKIEDGRVPSNYEECKSYIFISCRNTVLKHLYKVKKERDAKVMIDEVQIDFTEDNSLSDARQEKINTVLNKLKDGLEKDIFKLRVQGYSIQEISQKLDLTELTVENANRNLIRNARNLIFNKKIKKKIIHRKYSVINTETDELVFVGYNKRVISDKYRLSRYRIDKYIDTNIIFNKNLIIKSENYRNTIKK